VASGEVRRPSNHPHPRLPYSLTHSLTYLFPDSKSIYVLLLVYAASTSTTVIPCLAVVLATPAATAGTLAGATASLTTAQRTLLLSSYVPFFVIPLVMTIDMAFRVLRYVRASEGMEVEKKRR
jgi:hypothetical protein